MNVFRRPPKLARILSPIREEIDRQRGIRSLLTLLDDAKRPVEDYFADRLNSPAAARALTLKAQNLCVARYHFLARSTTLLSRPYGLEVDPLNNCNLACPGCVHSATVKEKGLFDWRSGMLSEDTYTGLLKRYAPYAIQISLCNYGEPLLNPATPRFIRLAKSYLLRTSLSTNMAAPRFDAEAWAASGLDYMTVSIDGATQPVYERYRKKGNLDLALRNIRALVEAKRRLGRKTPVISWQFLAFEHNAHEIDLATTMARHLGVDIFRVAAPFDVSWDDAEIRAASVSPATHVLNGDPEQMIAENWDPFPDEIAANAIQEESEISWVSRLDGIPAEEIERREGGAGAVCHWLYKNMVMDATGRVMPCCAAPQPKADLVFGQLNGASSVETASGIFNSSKYRLARLSFQDKTAYRTALETSGLDRDPHCVNCDWYGDQEMAHIDRSQVQSYLRTATRGLFDPLSIETLSGF